MDRKYNSTIYACFVGFVVQAIVNIFVPLLFVRFRSEFSLPLSQISILIAANFVVQLFTDISCVYFVDKIGYRTAAVTSQFLCGAGLILITVFPRLLGNSFAGLLVSVMIYAVGGGLIEVVGSPIVESCPTPNKEKAMSMLHSFYCWGSVAVIALSTLFFAFFGLQNWRVASILWSIVPIVNGFVFMKVPILTLESSGEKRTSLREMFTDRLFILFIVAMVCSGASEISVSQWASTFVESSLGVSKSVGDIAGPMMFAVLAGLSRTFYGKFGEKVDLHGFMLASSALGIVSYLLISLSRSPAFGLVGCAMCGLSIGLMWPGTYSIASKMLKGGTSMFAILALAGDIGCSVGPSLVGFVSEAAKGNLKAGFLAATVFPLVMFAVLLVLRHSIKHKRRPEV